MIQRFALFDPNLTCRIMISARHVPLKTLSVRTVQESAASAPVSDLIQAASIAHAARRDSGSQQLRVRLSLQSNQLRFAFANCKQGCPRAPLQETLRDRMTTSGLGCCLIALLTISALQISAARQLQGSHSGKL